MAVTSCPSTRCCPPRGFEPRAVLHAWACDAACVSGASEREASGEATFSLVAFFLISSSLFLLYFILAFISTLIFTALYFPLSTFPHYLFFYIFLYLFFYIYFSISISYIYLSISISLYLFLYFYFSISIFLFLFIFIFFRRLVWQGVDSPSALFVAGFGCHYVSG